MFRPLSDDGIVLFLKIQRHLPASLFDAFLGDGEILGVFLDAYILSLLDHSSHAGSAAPHRIVKNYPPELV